MLTYFTEFGDCLEDPLGGGGVVELGHVLLPDQRVLDGHPRPGAGPRPRLAAVHTANTGGNDLTVDIQLMDNRDHKMHMLTTLSFPQNKNNLN